MSISLYSNAYQNLKSNSYVKVLLITPECGYSCNLIIVSSLHLSSIDDILEGIVSEVSATLVATTHKRTLSGGITNTLNPNKKN